MDPADTGRMVALMGDAELDEGNIYECLIEAAKHDIRNCWWIVDYNRQSLDATTADRMFRRFDEIFVACGWRVVTLKYGKLMEAAFAEAGGEALKAWIDDAPNADYAALTYLGGAAWRERLLREAPDTKPLLDARDDEAVAALMTNLAGHDLASLTEAFDGVQDDVPTFFIVYTIKGFGLPFAGHKDNHAGLMNPGQVAALREQMGVAEGEEWEPWAGLGGNSGEAARALVARSRIAREKRSRPWNVADVPAISPPSGREQSTQAAFGKILNELAKTGGPLADRIVTTSPDVTVSTNLGGFVNQRGLFRRQELADVFAAAKIPSPQKWAGRPAGQHVELGIAENNLFLMLAALGLAGDVFGERLFPIGTVYDPFIARGLDALNYACYQDARFMLVATPSGVTLGPEGGAHQSINPP
jgi:pyruvate dehydrogenase E1 component